MTDLPERLRFDWAWFEQAASHWDRTRAVTECVALLEKHHGTMAEAAAEIERLTVLLETGAVVVAADEREACALVADYFVRNGDAYTEHGTGGIFAAECIASAIRARGEK